MKSESGNTGTVPLNKFVALKKLNHLRIEKGEIGREVGALEMLGSLEKLELIDAELKQGFSEGMQCPSETSCLIFRLVCYRVRKGR